MKFERDRHALRSPVMLHHRAQPAKWRRVGNGLRTHEVLAKIMSERNAEHRAIRLFDKAQLQPALRAERSRLGNLHPAPDTDSGKQNIRPVAQAATKRAPCIRPERLQEAVMRPVVIHHCIRPRSNAFNTDPVYRRMPEREDRIPWPLPFPKA